MDEINVTFPVPLKDFIDAEVASGRYNSPGDYLQSLVREDQVRKARAKIDSLLVEGLLSGESAPLTAESWQEIRREVQERQSRRNGQ